MRGIKGDVWNPKKAPDKGYTKPGGYDTIYIKDIKSLIKWLDDGDCNYCPLFFSVGSFMLGMGAMWLIS